MNNRIISTEIIPEEENYENILRPQSLSQYIGQKRVRENIEVYTKAAKLRGETLDHVLLYGPPGLGKTTLSSIIANEMGVNIKIMSGPAIEKTGELAAILAKLSDGDVLFIDEIHRLNRQIEEFLYPAMEDFRMDVIIGEGASAISKSYQLKRFTLVGATTRAGMLTAPLRDRFGIIERLEFYTVDELREIAVRSAAVLGIEIDDEGAMELARRARGTPRLVNRLLKRVRDYAQVKFDGVITKETADYALNILEVDKNGLDKNDRLLLEKIINQFKGGPVGIEALAASLGEDTGTLEDVYEPYLVQNEYISRTRTGRIATEKAYLALGIDKNKEL